VSDTTPNADLLATARAWHDQDPDEFTKAELATLILAAETGDPEGTAELARRFAARLEFGTAGLRGELGAGSARMNRVLVAQAAAGLAAFLLEKSPNPSIVIGYDGRKNSDVFARDTAEIMAGAGVRAVLLPRMLPTPVLAFAVRHLDASAGVMVTASHNPARDNGYKVYLGGLDHGSQIVAPADAEIAATRAMCAAEVRVPELPRSADVEIAGDDLVDEYVRRTAALAPASDPAIGATAPVKVVYTAMHGVGWEVAKRVFAEAGFAEPVVVTEQIEPDPAFPTVSFPNPEEPGALDLAFATATAAGADLIIANDPDADRLAVAVPDGGGGWRRLSGNDVGALLGWRAAERIAVAGSGTMAASLVSSPALSTVASQYHVDYAETLTGFKWISRVGGLAFGYEEALGYLVDPDKVLDKDGISAAVDFLSLVTELAGRGQTIADHEIAFAEKFGAFASSQISIRVSDLADITALMARLRDAPPAEIAGLTVDHIDDFAAGFGQYPAGDILRIVLDGDARVIVRPSGTEPKLKVYIDASAASGTGVERRAAAERTVAEIDAAMRGLLA
jgi:phosphomannomutase